MEQVRTFLAAWLPLITAVIGWIVVRYSKPDTTLPLNVPVRLRPWIPVVFSIVLSAVQKFVIGSTLEEALRTAIIGGLAPMFAHQFVTESIMGGKEIPVPFMVKKPSGGGSAGGTGFGGIRFNIDVSEQDPDRFARIVAKHLRKTVGVTGTLLVLMLASCGWWTPAKEAAAVKAGEDYSICVLEHVERGVTDPKIVAIECAIAEIPDAIRIITAAERVAAKRVEFYKAAHPMVACPSPAPSSSSKP